MNKTGPVTASSATTAVATAVKVAPPSTTETAGLGGLDLLHEDAERRVDEIEMIGEEEAAELVPAPRSEITPGLRYLHCSRTIHQLVTDRNRAVGLYLAVASLLWTGSGALLNASPKQHLMVPIELIQRWCLPATFAVLAVLALFVSFLLIRTRIGLIYEVAKMNVLLGLPIGRVKRINPLSIFFIMHLLISSAGGLAGGLFVLHLLYAGRAAAPISELGASGRSTMGPSVLYSALTGIAITVLLVVLYVVTVRHTTADKRLQDGAAK